MIVSEILKKKGRNAVTTYPTLTIRDAISLFMERKVGAVLVCAPSGKILGLLTERDVLHGIAEYGPEALDMKVETVMTRKIHTCTPSDQLSYVMALMMQNLVRHIPVVDNGELKGIISAMDTIRNRLDEAQLEVDTLRDYARLHP